MNNNSQHTPLVSIIMPTYNCARFLPDSFKAIKNQKFKDWELIVVDDGSTDNTKQIFDEISENMIQPTKLIIQENAGAYTARANGISHANGKYIAMYDADDQWLSHHLSDSVTALENNPEVDWVFASAKTINEKTKEVVCENYFYDTGSKKLKSFFQLETKTNGNLEIVTDSNIVSCMIEPRYGFHLQASVIKKEIFQKTLFRTDMRNGEDWLFSLRAVKNGAKVAYFNDVHFIYNVHDNNSSAISTASTIEKNIRIYQSVTDGYKDLFNQLDLTSQEKTILNDQLAHHYFWELGYNLLWCNKHYKKALKAFADAREHKSYNWAKRKMYYLCKIKYTLLFLAGKTR